MKTPLISFIVPVYNAEEYITECINSIKRISSVQIECILIDDGSSDHSLEKCHLAVKGDNRFRVIHTENHGVSHARNVGLDHSCGKYVTFIDSDDYILSIDFDFLNNAPIYSLGMCSSDQQQTQKVAFQDTNDISKNFIKYPSYMNSVCNKYFRKDIIDCNNLRFDVEQYAAEDLLFLITFLVMSGSQITYIDKQYYCYRMNSLSLTHKSITAETLVNYRNTYNKIIDIISKNNVQIQKYQKFIKFFRMQSAILYLIDPDNYDLQRFRQLTKRSDLWTYDKRIDIYFDTLFAQLNLSVIPNVYIMLKRKAKR